MVRQESALAARLRQASDMLQLQGKLSAEQGRAVDLRSVMGPAVPLLDADTTPTLAAFRQRIPSGPTDQPTE